MAKNFYRKFTDYRDTGFGTKVTQQGDRFINRDGSFNVERRGLPFWERFSFYHTMINASWGKFILVILTGYVFINVVFALLYLAIGFENLDGTRAQTDSGRFLEAFFFSAQTFTTVGYGRINPVGVLANILVVVELLMGLLSLALATGLFYARSSRPVGKILFSGSALIAPFRDITAFMFRIANARENQLIDVEVKVLLSWVEEDKGEKIRKFYQLPLERDRVNFLALSWTIVHPMDEQSPMYGLAEAELEQRDAEFLVMIKGYDDTYGQTIHARSSYKYFEIKWGARFVNTFSRSKDGSSVIDLSTLSVYEPAELPLVEPSANHRRQHTHHAAEKQG